MTRKYPLPDLKILYGRAAGRCAFTHCRQELVLEETATDKTKQIGKIAHIVAHSAGGPRHDPSYPADELDAYENWVLLCPTCHDTVDAHEGKYSVQVLRDIKSIHEQWVRDTLSDAMPQVGFAELEVAVKGIAQQSAADMTEFSVIPPDKKITKNQLSDVTRKLLVMGLMQSVQVKKYLEAMEQIHDGFASRLVGGFKSKYTELSVGNQSSSDAVFESILSFACSNATDFATRAAGLALLSHLFETCEVFKS